MIEWFKHLAMMLSDHAVFQGMLAACCTFILEDPTTVGCGLLVADGKMGHMTALLGVGLGIALGDLGLYGIGWFFGPRTVRWGFLRPQQFQRAHGWLEKNLIWGVFVTRFIPGMRFPAYVGAGILRASFLRFTIVVVIASFLWTVLLLQLTIKLGIVLLPVMGQMKWLAVLAIAIAVIAVQSHLARRGKRAMDADASSTEEPAASAFEFWPPWLFYFPVGLYWLWLGLKHRGLMLPTAVNPSIYSSGMVGESKSQILGLVPEPHRRWVAPYTEVVRPGPEATDEQLERRGLERMNAAGLEFPVVAKPDIGQRGTGVRLVKDARQLTDYLKSFPPNQKLIVQKLIPASQEAGIMYYRKPGEERGRIFSMTLKLFPTVVGDGQRTLKELILDDRRAILISEGCFKRHAAHLDRVLAPGEVFKLVFSGNHCQGAVFRDACDQATPELLERIHQIASAMPEFYFGRFDVRFDQIEELKRGEGFQILEINGAGAEAIHIWDSRKKLREAYATLRRQYEALFEIGAINRTRGFKGVGLVQMIRDFRFFRRLARHYPPTS